MDAVRRNKTAIGTILCADYGLILNKVDEKKLITRHEYNNLKSINGVDVWGHVIALVDKIMNKGEDTCEAFLNLLQTDDDVKSTYPQLKNLQWSDTIQHLTPPVQASSDDCFGMLKSCNVAKQIAPVRFESVMCHSYFIDGIPQDCKRTRRVT